MHGIQTWIQYKDRKLALEAQQTAYSNSLESEETRKSARKLIAIVPQETIDLLRQRVDECQKKFTRMLENAQEYFEEDLMDATRNALPACVCRNLAMIINVAGDLPDEKLEEAWLYFKCRDRQDGLILKTVRDGGMTSALSQKSGA